MKKLALTIPAFAAAVGIIAGCSAGSPAHSTPSQSMSSWLSGQGGKDWTKFDSVFNSYTNQIQKALVSNNVNDELLGSVDAGILATEANQAAKLPPPVASNAYTTAMTDYASAFHLLMNPANYSNVSVVNQATADMNSGTSSLQVAIKAIGGK